MSNERVLPGLLGTFKGFADKFSDDWHLWADLNWLQTAVLLNGNVLSQVTTLPSGTEGQIYIVKVGDANEKKVAVYTRTDYGPSGSADWTYYDPIEGWVFYVLDEDLNYQYDGTAWIELTTTFDINSLPEDTTPDGAADFVASYDDSTSLHKKVKMDNLPGGGGGGGGGGGALIGMQIFTTAGTSTYTPTAGTRKVKIYVTGGGGGGGGCDTAGGDATAGSGQGGATAISLLDVADVDGDTITVGAKGAAGASTGGDGGDGGVSSVGADISAVGGTGGTGTTGGTISKQAASQAITGDIQIKGGDGEPSSPAVSFGSGNIGNPNVPGRPGGCSYWAQGIWGNTVFSGNTSVGVNGEGYGTGGTGGLATNDGAATAGGTGADGIVVIEEYGIPEAVINPQTGTAYTLALVDANAIVEMDNASANVLTIPTNAAVPFPIGTVISVPMIGVGVTSITGDTAVTLNDVSAGSGDISAQFGVASLYKRATDSWLAYGDIGAVS